MRKFIPKYKIFESNIEKAADDYWFKRMEESYREYIKGEESYNAEQDRLHPDSPPTEPYWLFENPINKMMKEMNLIKIVPAIISIGEELNLSVKDVILHHYMHNDFTIKWKKGQFTFPSISFDARTKEENNSPVKMIKKDDYYNPNIHPNHILITVFKTIHSRQEFQLFKESDIDDVVLDIRTYLMKQEITLDPNIKYTSEKTWFIALSRYLIENRFLWWWHPDNILQKGNHQFKDHDEYFYEFARDRFLEGKSPKEVGDEIITIRKDIDEHYS